MVENETEKSNILDFAEEPQSDLSYLIEMMNGKKLLIKGVIDDFLIQIPEELQNLKNAIENMEYPIIKKVAHSMKSSVSIMGISSATIVLKEIEDLSAKELSIDKIIDLNQKLNLICNQAIEEIEKDKINYT